MKQANYAVNYGLTAAFVFAAGFSARATITMTFGWDQTYYEAGYTSTYISSDDAIGIYQFSTSGNGISNPFWSVCLSPAGLLDGGTYQYNVESLASASPGIYPSAWAQSPGPSTQYWGIDNAVYLWSTYGMGIVDNSGNIGNQNQRAAALEFAIWTALYDSTGYGHIGNSDWAAPTSQMDPTTLAAYNSYIAALNAATVNPAAFAGDSILEGVGAVSGGPDSGQSQEFILLKNPSPLVTPAPEPTTLLAGALLLLPFGASALRLLRQNRTA